MDQNAETLLVFSQELGKQQYIHILNYDISLILHLIGGLDVSYSCFMSEYLSL